MSCHRLLLLVEYYDSARLDPAKSQWFETGELVSACRYEFESDQVVVRGWVTQLVNTERALIRALRCILVEMGISVVDTGEYIAAMVAHLRSVGDLDPARN